MNDNFLAHVNNIHAFQGFVRRSTGVCMEQCHNCWRCNSHSNKFVSHSRFKTIFSHGSKGGCNAKTSTSDPMENILRNTTEMLNV